MTGQAKDGKVGFMILGRIKKVFCVCIFLGLAGFLFPQTAERMEELLRAEALSYGQVAQFVLEAADAAAPSGPAQAFSFAADRNWLPKKAAADDEAKLDGLSLLVMESFGFKGGMFYSLLKNPHYAYRELTYHRIIQGRSDPGMAVSGEMLLFVVNRALSESEENL